MCAVSAVYAYGQTLPPTHWTIPTIDQFKILLDAAKQYDQVTGQPECHDPAKELWFKTVALGTGGQ